MAATIVTAPWEGVSNVERELVDCCESLEDHFNSNDNSDQDTDEDGDEDETDNTGGLLSTNGSASSSALLSSSSPTDPIGGVLAIEKETRFAATLSRGCHTIASRSLALAILERTLEVYLAEEATSALLLQQQQQKSKDDEKEDSEENEDDANANDGNTSDSSHNMNERTTEPSQQSMRYENRVKRQRLLADEDGQNVSDDATTTSNVDNLEIYSSSSPLRPPPATTSIMGTQHRNRRFDLFFGAGGLRILNQWLVDASSYDTTKTTTPLTASNSSTSTSALSMKGNNNNNKNSTAAMTHVIRRAHTTRPIALSILRFLEHIPFEKKTVKNSTINKQIQKLGKKVTLIQEAHQNGKAPKEDLDNWTTHKPPIVHDEALTQILVAVDAVKASWREKAKAKREKHQTNPFGTLQSKIKERLRDLTKFESGSISTRPEWYRPPLTPAAFKKKLSPPLKRKAPTEAEIEKLNLQKKIKQVQSKSQKSLQQLREKLRQRQAGHNYTHSVAGGARNSVSSFSSNKRVAWKDGMKSQVARNRQMLEEVFVFGKDLPSSAGGQEENLILTD
jgi:hypothetical protein